MWIVVILVAFLAAGLTLFSGFGLGSLLMPAFTTVFPLELAIAATAVVHLLNNLFKTGLLGRYASLRVVLVFAIPGAIAAYFGAGLLYELRDLEPLGHWSLGERSFALTPIGLTVGALIVGFAAFELHPRLKKIGVPSRFLALGGLLSGFLGGISGHQGALRTTFMVRLGLEKKAFLGTGIVSAVIIDVARISTYAFRLAAESSEAQASGGSAHDGNGTASALLEEWPLLLAGTLAAFLGSFLGRRMIEKVTMEGIRRLVGVMLLSLGLAVASGLIR